jgi:hypothetical protein
MTPTTDPTNTGPGNRLETDAHGRGLDPGRVIRFEQAIDIDRPVEEAFAYLADFTNIPQWNYFVEQVRQLTPGPVAVGTTYDQTRRTDRQRFEVTVYQAPRLLAVTTLRGERPAFHRHFELQPLRRPAGPLSGGGTRLHDRWELDLGYILTLQRLAAPRVKSAVGENLAVLKRLLEQGHR